MSAFDTPVPPFSASDPHATFLNSAALDLLMIEVVPLARRLAESSGSGGGGRRGNGEGDDEGNGEGGEDDEDGDRDGDREKTVVGTGGMGGGPGPEVGSGEERDALFYRLELLGFRVGHGLVERFSRDRARMIETLDVIKFICKDLWTIVFRKQIDNLKTNHRGVYVLTDNTFRPFARMSTEAGGNAVAKAQPFLWFPCGVVRGALANMGVNASVQAESMELPVAVFKIETINKPQ